MVLETARRKKVCEQKEQVFSFYFSQILLWGVKRLILISTNRHLGKRKKWIRLVKTTSCNGKPQKNVGTVSPEILAADFLVQWERIRETFKKIKRNSNNLKKNISTEAAGNILMEL